MRCPSPCSPLSLSPAQKAQRRSRPRLLSRYPNKHVRKCHHRPLLPCAAIPSSASCFGDLQRLAGYSAPRPSDPGEALGGPGKSGRWTSVRSATGDGTLSFLAVHQWDRPRGLVRGQSLCGEDGCDIDSEFTQLTHHDLTQPIGYFIHSIS